MKWIAALIIAISVSPRQGFEPLTVRSKTTVTPDAANREICVGWVSATGEMSRSCRTMDGADAPKTFWHTWLGLRAGSYVLIVEVTTVDGKTHTAQTSLNVLGEGNEP